MSCEREIEFFDCVGDETLSFADSDEAIEDYLDGKLKPDMTSTDVLAALPKVVTVKAFARIRVSDGDRKRLQGEALDRIIESLDEEYGSPEDESTVTDGMKAAAEAFVATVVSEYTPWACEQVDSWEVEVEPWIREHRPDWLKEQEK
jgi:hypothetical protein